MACNSCEEKKSSGKTGAVQSAKTRYARAGVEPFIRARAALCSLCEYNNAGVCTQLKKITPDKDCIVQIGVEMPRAYCPIGQWDRHNHDDYPQRRKCTQCGGYSRAFAEVCRQCVNKLEVSRRNIDSGHGVSPRVFSDQVGSSRATQLQKDMWDAVRNNPSRPRHRSAFTALYSDTTFITVNDLASDAIKLGNMLPPDVQAIVGVARSGITPANIIATMLHLPLLAIRQTKGDVVQVGNGWRMGGSEHIGTDRKAKVAIIDDTSMTGNSFKAIKPIAEQHFDQYVTGCLYVNPLSNMKPDLWVHDLPWPHLLEWNLFNSVLSPNCAVDFDGILCHDCAGWQDDDGANYKGFIDNAVPKYVARKTPIPMIVTARIEKYRDRTQAWLDRHGIRCNNLVMHPAKSLRERQRDDIAAFKARHFEAWAKSHHARPRPSMFIESDDAQAKRIAEITGRMVVCPSAAKVYGNPKK